jgi:hypothetical protein
MEWPDGPLLMALLGDVQGGKDLRVDAKVDGR